MNGRMSAKGGSASGGKNKILKFPEGFLWGAATSAHQVEGGTKNDWSEWEKKNAKRLTKEARTKWADWQQEKFPEMFDPKNYISGKACDHYNRYEEDLDIAKSLGHNAHRFSIEWSRIEPREGKFDEKEIEHYRKVLKAIRARGMEPFVTLWHFTNPLWIEKKGGWENKNTIKFFVRYADKMAEAFKDEVKFWTSFNEPTTYAGHIHIFGAWLSRKKSLLKTNKVVKNICAAHKEIYLLVHQKYGEKIKCGITFNLKHHSAHNSKKIGDRILAKADEFFRDTRYLEIITKHTDFLGLNYYLHDRLNFALGGKFFGLANIQNPNKEISDLGWDISPEGIYYVALRLKKYNLPIYITENGIADASDGKRKKIIKEHLQFVYAAIRHGVDVRGYFHWSLLVIFNWPVSSKNEKMNFGISYSPVFAKSLGLDWQKAYTDILDGLQAKKIRLASYWSEVEKEKGVYDFSETDWLINEAQKRNVKVVLAYGIKVPRWPECFIPSFYVADKTKRERALLQYEYALIERYKNFDNIEMWQAENEPFLPFGNCPARAIDGDLVSREVAQTKLLDPTRPVMVTDSGELSLWYQAAKRADIFGTTLYRTIYKPQLGYFNYPLGPNFFRTKALFIKIFANQKNIIISELQGEPWGPKWLNEMSLEEQYKSMSPQKLEDIAEYARKTNFSESYLWGAEWWYWLKTQKGESAMWDTAKKIISSNQ